MNTKSKGFEGYPHRQRGMTAIAMVAILAMVGFFAMIAIRLFPIYLEHFSVVKHLENVSEVAGVKEKTNGEILSTLNKRFQIDDVKHVTNENIFIEREKGGGMTIAIEYEVRTPALANVEMVVSFVDEVEVN